MQNEINEFAGNEQNKINEFAGNKQNEINEFAENWLNEINDFGKRQVVSVFQRKIYQKLLEWKRESDGNTALLIEGARRIGKSTVVEEAVCRRP